MASIGPVHSVEKPNVVYKTKTPPAAPAATPYTSSTPVSYDPGASIAAAHPNASAPPPDAPAAPQDATKVKGGKTPSPPTTNGINKPPPRCKKDKECPAGQVCVNGACSAPAPSPTPTPTPTPMPNPEDAVISQLFGLLTSLTSMGMTPSGSNTGPAQQSGGIPFGSYDTTTAQAGAPAQESWFSQHKLLAIGLGAAAMVVLVLVTRRGRGRARGAK